MALAVWAGSFAARFVHGPVTPAWLTVSLAVCAVGARRLRLLVPLLAVTGLAGGIREWSAAPFPAGPCNATVRLVDDPRAFGAATSVVVSVAGRHVRAYAYGSAGARFARMLAGERARVEGTCSPVRSDRHDRELVSHVVGRMSVTAVEPGGDDGGPVHRGANRIRRLMTKGTRTMARDTAALFAGLVIGDDRDQPRAMVEQFRRSGLSHLCSVSGQNVVYVLAAFGPFTRRLRPGPRLVSTLAVLAWFVVLTRAEPSVLRAAVMAGVVAVNFFRGRSMNARSVLAVSVTALLVVDPMLAHSVGFALSAGATAGLAWFSAPLERRGLPPVLAATVAAQAGTLPVSLAVFGRLSLVSFVANPLAVPVAGFVMLVGIPVALVAALVPGPVAAVIMVTVSVPTSFVAAVARVGSHLW